MTFASSVVPTDVNDNSYLMLHNKVSILKQ